MPPTARPKKSPAKKAAKARPKAARKAKPVRNAKPKAKPAVRAKPPVAFARKPYTAPARQLVARPRPGEHRDESWAEHDHHDPRHSGQHAPGSADAGIQAVNHGQSKARGVPRMDKVVNWFRRGAKPKQ